MTWRDRKVVNQADRFSGNEEPPLRELIDDPVLHSVLARDGIALDELMVILGQARERLRLGA